MTEDEAKLHRVKRFWAKVNKNGPIHPKLKTRCWLWTGTTTSDGYGHINWYGKYTSTHRVAWYIIHGKWPMPCGLHKCDNRPCCNPDHLFEGSRSDNMRDCRDKGRGVNMHGKMLTTKEVKAIRLMRSRNIPLKVVADFFNVAVPTVSAICTGRHHV